ncbi:MAG: glycerophosphodiester phosphodiesterase, partial [Desulfobacteraceae bacterium]|nr:glycerophosphodiester phosphodiesterase [Desulfobacteraceae bacterium]
MKGICIFALLAVLGMACTVILLGMTASKPEKQNGFDIIAHRGVHQDYKSSNKGIRTNKTYLNECTATQIHNPTHAYLENTIESIAAAFDRGATIVEIDIRPTKDDQLVVFHDWMLDCRTNGQGNVIDQKVKYLKTLDIGYGYTSDGATYPFRGKGTGKIKTLIEVLQLFPDKQFLIDNKNGNNIKTAQLILDTVNLLPEDQQKRLYLWCSDKAYAYIHERNPLITRLILPRPELKSFFKSYLLTLGFGNIPGQFKGQGIALPMKYTKYIPGWPNRFLAKIYEADMRFYLYLNT